VREFDLLRKGLKTKGFQWICKVRSFEKFGANRARRLVNIEKVWRKC